MKWRRGREGRDIGVDEREGEGRKGITVRAERKGWEDM